MRTGLDELLLPLTHHSCGADTPPAHIVEIDRVFLHTPNFCKGLHFSSDMMTLRVNRDEVCTRSLGVARTSSRNGIDWQIWVGGAEAQMGSPPFLQIKPRNASRARLSPCLLLSPSVCFESCELASAHCFSIGSLLRGM